MATILGKAHQFLRDMPPILLLLLMYTLFEVPVCVAGEGGLGAGALVGDSQEEESNEKGSIIINLSTHDQQQHLPIPSSSDAAQWCPHVIFNFGDSLTDTGNALATLEPFTNAANPPYGSSFFGKPTGRYSNGRLVVDFLLLAFRSPLLHPSELPTGGREVQGLNYAYAGATACDENGFHQYNLKFQLDEFRKAKSSAMKADHSTSSYLNELRKVNYGSALYTICIGGNDVLSALTRGLPTQETIEQVVPGVVQAIVDAIQTLYLQEARHFIIFNGPPEGCSPSFMSLMDAWKLPKDSLGCMSAVNEINQAINSGVAAGVRHLRGNLHGVSITLFDYYSANVEILTNPSKYGFNPRTNFVTCCGSPGIELLNYNPDHPCGSDGTTMCSNVETYINWDGIHFTEAFYRVITKFVLNGEFSDPPRNLKEECNLSFENFYGKSYEDIFPRGGPWASS